MLSKHSSQWPTEHVYRQWLSLWVSEAQGARPWCPAGRELPVISHGLKREGQVEWRVPSVHRGSGHTSYLHLGCHTRLAFYVPYPAFNSQLQDNQQRKRKTQLYNPFLCADDPSKLCHILLPSRINWPNSKTISSLASWNLGPHSLSQDKSDVNDHCFLSPKPYDRDCRKSSAIKSTCCSSVRPEFSSQHPQ